MRITFHIECDCGKTCSFVAKRTVEKFEGKVYEDYSSITDGIKENSDEKFSATTSPDTVHVTCNNCKKKHELVL